MQTLAWSTDLLFEQKGSPFIFWMVSWSLLLERQNLLQDALSTLLQQAPARTAHLQVPTWTVTPVGTDLGYCLTLFH